MYLALYRKYRPQTFADVISQPHITTTLQNQIKSGQTAHAYLFTGSRGTGKTTCAKILAKALNCANSEDGNPCLKCEYCKTIEEGTSDILEIDAASNNGVDDVRALRDEVMYSPVSCKYRVYIIDEVHMLSMSAFNALLKTIEEPPPHVVFILATTESHKVPATILSRCQRFEFRRIDMRDSAKRLLEIAEKEKVTLGEDAALLISRLSDGGMRDALSLLDQCISVSDNVTPDIVRECAGIAGKEHLFGIGAAVLEKNPAKALEILNELHNASKDLGRLIDELILHFRNLMLMKTVPDSAAMTTMLPDERIDYQRQCDAFTLEGIMRAMSILEECFEQIGRSGQRKILAEMCIIRLCSPRLDTDGKAVQSLSLRLSELEQRVESGGFSPRPAEAPRMCPPTEEQPKYAEEVPAPEDAAEEYEPTMPEPEDAVPQALSPVMTTESGDYLPNENERCREWAEILEKVPPYLAGMIDNTATYCHGDIMYVKGGAIAKGVLENKDNIAALRSAVYETLGRSYVLRYLEEEKKQVDTESKVEKFLAHAKELGVVIKSSQGSKK